MRNRFSFLVILFLLSAINAIASDIYAEYKLTGLGSKNFMTKTYIKDGNFRTEIDANLMGRQMTNTSLILKSKPDVVLSFNSMNKFYTETKVPKNAATLDFTIKVLGKEKVGKYNCTRVQMTSKGKSFEAWFTNELPSVNLPMGNESGLNSEKLIAQLKSKGIDGMMVKAIFPNPRSSNENLTMELTKYETKTLSPSLFVIPKGYKKSPGNAGTKNFGNMSREQQKEMLKNMMKEPKKN